MREATMADFDHDAPETYRTVADYISDARVLLQDQISPFRYDDSSLITALNATLLEVKRLRPDLIIFEYGYRVPSFDNTQDAEDLNIQLRIEDQFRLGIVYGLCSHALVRDQEDVQDDRSASFMRVFNAAMLGLALPAVSGGAVAGGKQR